MSKLRQAVERARDQFAFYGREHRKKERTVREQDAMLASNFRTTGGDAVARKALVNEELAIEMQQALDDAPFDILSLDKVQDYRFGSMVKGEHYAYARGLTINPTHLPAALDAMETDGWTLMSVFGQTDSENVGFIFKRTGVPRRVQELLESNTALVLENRELKAAQRMLQDDGK